MSKMEELRDHLFETLQDLKKAEKPMELDRAKAIVDVAQTIINSAKIEVDYLKVTGQGQDSRSEFFPASSRLLPPVSNGKPIAESLDGKTCSDCRDQGKEAAATRKLPGGTVVCEMHFRKRSGMAVAASA